VQRIPLDEVAFEPASVIDDAGRVFWWKDHLYRAIKHDHVEFYRGLFDQKNVKVLFSKGLVPAAIAPLSLDGYGLVLRHPHILFTSYCVEWSSEMLKDAALLICDLGVELHAQGLAFKDSHPWNILFDAGQPVFVDWGSIGSIEQRLPWPYLEFRSWFILPLCLMSAGLSKVARLFMLDVPKRPSRRDVFRRLVRRVPPWTWLRYWADDRKHFRARFDAGPTFFRSLRKTIEAIPVSGESTEWTDYQGPDVRFSHQSSDQWPAKIRNVYELLQTLRPKTVLDVGCNRGWFSELAALQGAQVVAIDIDEPSINTLYRRVHANGSSILPLVMNICAPTPAHGMAHAYAKAPSRLQSDMVLALALTHHLVFKRGLAFEDIAERLAAFTRKWLVVEFVPANDRYVSEWMNERFAWYHLEGFTTALQAFFRRIEVLDSFPPPRVLLLCER
jgi:SAM-dependent methyltransferase